MFDMSYKDLFIRVLEVVGTFAGAISGVRLASVKRFDWFGASVIGVVTACGGGTLRDFCIGATPFWMSNPIYLETSLIAVVAVGLFGRRFISGQITWFVFDTISISVFMIIGIQKSIAFGYTAWWCAIMMGLITAVFGGVLRDICINEVPLIFRKELYAVACGAGGVLYFLLPLAGVESIYIRSVLGVGVIFVVRALAIKYHLGVPVLKGRGTTLHQLQHNRHLHHRQAGQLKPETKK